MTQMIIPDAPALSRFFRMAVVAGVESAVKIHIDRGDDLNARDAQGQTPLMLSAARNKGAICKLLLDAGADADLLDHAGRSALVIAHAVGADAAVQAIEKAGVHAKKPEFAADPATLPPIAATDQSPPLSGELPDASKHKSATVLKLDLGASDGEGFDLAGWEAEEDQPAPEDDPTQMAAAFQVQSVITEHQPIDTSVDWDDFDAFLPDRATPLVHADDVEARERLRLVLLRAIREGSIPQSALDELTLSDDGEPDVEAVALLGMVVNDLGAETDERFEYWAPHESFEVFVSPEERSGEVDAIAEALAFVDALASRRKDPLRIYQRELQREALLTAEAEVELGQGMERGLEHALDALAGWSSGIGATLDAAQKVLSGTMPLRWLSSGPQAELQECESPVDFEIGSEATRSTGAMAETEGADEDSDSQFDPEARDSGDELAEFCVNVKFLAGLAQGGGEVPKLHTLRGAISGLGLTRNFLLELADFGRDEKTEAGLAFLHAMCAYRDARDKLATANLKLVFSVARKYLFSGQPLDDLLQEGNIGLLKAVDKYDWRRGFKFSTYATWWIRQQVGRFVAEKSKTIRLPVHVYEKTQRIAQTTFAFDLERGRSPTVEEIAKLVDLPVRKVASLAQFAQEPLSIDAIDDLDSLVAADAVEQFTARDPMDIVEDAQLVDLVDRFLDVLTITEASVVRMRFGIGVQDAMTLEEIGTLLDVTRERVRQIEVAALRKFRHPARLDKLLRDLNGTSRANFGDESKLPDNGDEFTANAIAAEHKIRRTASVTLLSERCMSSGPTVLNRLLEQARALGIAVDDDSENGARKILVHITDAPDNRLRKLVRKLINMGFEFRPGKGYWR